MELKESYGKFRKKYPSLPPFEKLDLEFDVSCIEQEAGMLSKIRKRITEKIESVGELVNSLLQPEPTLANMRESQEFSEDDKRGLFVIYRALMYLHRSSLHADLIAEEKVQADTISKMFTKWQQLKPALQKILKKMADSWEAEDQVEETTGYFG